METNTTQQPDWFRICRELQPFTDLPLSWLAVRIAGHAILEARLAELDLSTQGRARRAGTYVARVYELFPKGRWQNSAHLFSSYERTQAIKAAITTGVIEGRHLVTTHARE